MTTDRESGTVCSSGKPPNAFGLEERAMGREYTMQVVEETHEFWQQLVAKGQRTV